MNTISIIPYSEKNHRALVIEWLIDLQEIERKLTPTRRPGKDMAEDYFDSICRSVQSDFGAMFVAQFEERPVGFIACFVIQGDDIILTDEANVHGYISDAYVEESMRGKGIFKTLEAKAIEHLKSQGMKSVEIKVVAQNEPAVTAYHKAGYKSEEISLRKDI